jgi:hypothetical protein
MTIVPYNRACGARSAERIVAGGKPFSDNQPCTELGMAFTPKDPQAASSPLLNERGDSRGWCPWTSTLIAREWPHMFQVTGGSRRSTRCLAASWATHAPVATLPSIALLAHAWACTAHIHSLPLAFRCVNSTWVQDDGRKHQIVVKTEK